MLALRDGDVPQTISTSYSDDEQTGKKSFPILSLYITMWARVSNDRVVKSIPRVPDLTFASFPVPKDYAIRVCKEFGLLGESYFMGGASDLFVCWSCTGSRGVSIIFSSGDAGVGDGNSDPATQQCFSNDGQNKPMFLPMFPASCPLCVMPTTVSPQISSHRSCLYGQRHYGGWDSGNPGDRGAILGWGFQQLRKLEPPVAGPAMPY